MNDDGRLVYSLIDRIAGRVSKALEPSALPNSPLQLPHVTRIDGAALQDDETLNLTRTTLVEVSKYATGAVSTRLVSILDGLPKVRPHDSTSSLNCADIRSSVQDSSIPIPNIRSNLKYTSWSFWQTASKRIGHASGNLHQTGVGRVRFSMLRVPTKALALRLQPQISMLNWMLCVWDTRFTGGEITSLITMHPGEDPYTTSCLQVWRMVR